MINVNTKIHDKFSIEFKVGFTGSEKDQLNDFSVNTWIFVPYSLDINRSTYGKEQFYHDVKSNIRLITPKYSLAGMAQSDSNPIRFVRSACQRLQVQHSDENLTECDFQLRIFAAIFKSALRNECKALLASPPSTEWHRRCAQLQLNIRQILDQYRECAVPDGSASHNVYLYADEYMSHLTDVQLSKIIKHLDDNFQADNQASRTQLTDFLLQERAYKTTKGYSHISEPSQPNNNELVYRHGLLKKNIESALYLRMDTAPDSNAAQEISFGAAAGIAMILSTLIALPFQKYLGNYPILIFIILVAAYIFKDRIKDFIRYRFAHRLKAKYYDNKTTINFKNSNIGWIKEGVDFINDKKTPSEVLAIRNRNDLESDNSIMWEQTILYRKQVHIENDKMRNHYQYDFVGINDILRLHIQQFTQKMDDPDVIIHSVDHSGDMQAIRAERLYHFHIVQQFVHNEQSEYRGFEITATRDGITECTETTRNNINH